MGYPKYTRDGKILCQHIFCDNRVARNIATHKVTQVSPINGHHTLTFVCDSHLPVIWKVLQDNDYAEVLCRVIP